MSDVVIGILVLSDRASAGKYEDISGKAIMSAIDDYLITPHSFDYRIIADEQPLIESALIDFCKEPSCPLALTTGGTGPAPRDVTPEAMENVCEKMLPGFGELMRQVSLRHVPTAILSRQSAGIRGKTLIINLPGKPSSIRECLDAVFPAVPYCLELIGAPMIETNENIIKAFYPKQN
ncbi:MAG: molybdopterin adenylyltransferase [Helicobacteraceae bacterium]|jgi:molybdopterin adenylyltransferase|nr:molybdopterin adenylyltransferase [Helicobacteraceae bacterium]